MALCLGQARDHSTSTRSPHGALNVPCQNCHTSVSWKPIRAIPEFDHDKTSYPLRGMHKDVACSRCHAKPVFADTSTRCADCHADFHRRQMGANCEQCHNVRGWDIVTARAVNNHENRFPLVGGHATLECDSCHKSAAVGQFQGLDTACYSCHAKTYQQTTEPNHVTAGFPTTCEQCHGFSSWYTAQFDHLKQTGFALTGMHATLECTACHAGGKFKGTPATCVGCHLKDYQKASNPNHIALGLPQTCQQCHSTSGWEPASFDHNSVGFPLNGGHANLQCSQCHGNNNFNLTTTACVSCHLKDYQGTTNPNHVQGGFSQQCQICHTIAGWSPASFNHNNTGFPLTGAHATVQCAQCHTNNNYNLTQTNCVSCHLKDYQGTSNPNHVAGGFPQQCESCHTTSGWSPASFNHNNTGFPLTGAHATVQCAQCHTNNNYNLSQTSCVSCHLKDYQGASSPNHVAGAFPQQCEVCHSTSGWSPASFNHDTTGFALTGAHTKLACTQCHLNNNYNLTSAACVNCHLKEFQNTNDPNHSSAGFPPQCDICHSTSAWSPSTFNHNNTGFALTGAHTNLACGRCHLNNNYTLNSGDCYTCHSAEYQSATPNHISAGFPKTCATCHTTTSWLGATFNHTWFPTKHGGAQGVCSTCHTNPADYSVFQCTNCHTKARTDSEHQGNRNYVYNSVNCYNCHPTGGGG